MVLLETIQSDGNKRVGAESGADCRSLLGHEETWRTLGPPRVAEDRAACMLPIHQRLPRILVAEDDYELRRLIAEALRGIGCEVIEVRDGLQLRDRLEYSRSFFRDRYDFDLVVSDVRMPGLTGIEALGGLGSSVPAPLVILITAFGDQEAYRRAARLGAAAFFDKPLDLDELCDYVRGILPLPARESDQGEDVRLEEESS